MRRLLRAVGVELRSIVVTRFPKGYSSMPGALIDLGIESAFDFFREVAWPNHVAFSRRPSTIAALNAAWAYWHLHEWHFWDHQPSTLSRKKREDLLEECKTHISRDCPELEWLRDMTDASKHRRLHRPVVRVRSISTRTIGGPLGTAPIGTRPISATLAKIVVDVEGTTHDLEAVLEVASLYWLGTLLPYRVSVPRGPPELSESMLGWCRARLGSEQQGRWKWTLLKPTRSSDSPRQLAFREKADAEAFERWRVANPGRAADC